MMFRPTNKIYHISKAVRDKLELKQEEGVYFYCGTVNLCPNHTIKDVYDKYKDKDGFLYITVNSFDTFGRNN